MNAKRLVTLLSLTLCVGIAPAANAGENDDASLVVVDGGFAQFTLNGLLQTQFVPFLGEDARLSSGDPADAPGVRLRRARLGVSGWAWGMVDWELSMQASSGGMELLDAWVGYRGLTGIGFVVGARKVPFSRFAMMGAGDSALVDRPLGVQAMAPFRQVGMTVEGDIGNGILNWSLGVYNGFARNQSFNEGFKETTALEGNRFTRLAYVAHASLAPLGPLGEGLADFSRGGPRVGLGGSFYYDDGKTVGTLGLAANLVYKHCGFHFVAEYLYDSAEPTTNPTTDATVPAEVSRQALIAELGYLLIADELGLTARFELLDDNMDLDNAGDQIVVAGGLQYYFHRQHLKAQLEYTHRSELDGPSLDNDSLVLQVQFEL